MVLKITDKGLNFRQDANKGMRQWENSQIKMENVENRQVLEYSGGQ